MFYRYVWQVVIWDTMYNKCTSSVFHTNEVRVQATTGFLIYWRHGPKEMITAASSYQFNQTNMMYCSQTNLLLKFAIEDWNSSRNSSVLWCFPDSTNSCDSLAGFMPLLMLVLTSKETQKYRSFLISWSMCLESAGRVTNMIDQITHCDSKAN